MIRALAGIGTVPLAPTPMIRLSRTTTSPEVMISSPFIVMIRAPLKTTVPRGLSFDTVTTISTRAAS